jgi:putative zinc finger/helix-turn-helix YgiT family protein
MGEKTMTAPDGLTNDVCERCLKGTVSPVVVDAVYTHEGETVTYKDEFMRCDHCAREFYTTEQSMARSAAITAALRHAKHFPTGDEIRRIRLSYELSLKDFERALGAGKNTVGRWERSTVPPTGAANFGLWVAANYRDVFRKWAEMRGVHIKARPMRELSGEATTSASASVSPTVLQLMPEDDAESAASAHTEAGPTSSAVVSA